MLADKIRRYTKFAVAIFFSSLLAIGLFISTLLRNNMRAQEEQFAQLVESVTKTYASTLEKICMDYSLWDEMYNYVELKKALLQGAVEDVDKVKERTSRFESTYLDLAYLSTFGADYVCVFADGKELYSAVANEIPEVKLGHDAFEDAKYQGCFFIKNELGEPVQICMFPITRSTDYDRTQPNGWLVMGNALDVTDRAVLEELTDSTVKISGEQQRGTFRFLVANVGLRDRNNHPIAFLVFKTEFKGFGRILFGMIILVLTLTAFVTAFLFVVSKYLSAYLIRPFSDIVYSIENNTTDTLEQYTVRDDEIGQLSKAIKEYLHQKEQINLYLKELESKNVSLRRLNEEVRRLLEKDTLTGLLTRYVFNSQIERLYVSSKADRIPLSALSLDLDGFKQVNDHLGHQKGDEVLQKVGKIILESTRLSDFPIRMGGDEILILLPQADAEAAYHIGERIRKKIEEAFEKEQYKVTVSIGVTQLKGEDTIDSFLKRVDEAMYISKNNGKNRTTVLL